MAPAVCEMAEHMDPAHIGTRPEVLAKGDAGPENLGRRERVAQWLSR